MSQSSSYYHKDKIIQDSDNSLFKNLKSSPFFIRLTNWEYWNMFVVYIPIIIYWLYLSLKARSFFYFTASNPSIETGGLFGESKMKIMDNIPDKWKPTTVFIPKNSNQTFILDKIQEHNLSYPLIVKPDIGGRGLLVLKAKTEKALLEHILFFNVDFIIQAYNDDPEELSVMYYRDPTQEKGYISSLCVKHYLSVVGDGVSTIEALMQQKPRAILQLERFQREEPKLLQTIPQKGERIKLEPIGNHARGTMFVDGNHLIDDELVQVFDEVSKASEGIFFARYDLKCKSIEALKRAELDVLEINGAGAEPAHIYDPNTTYLKAVKDLLFHWKMMYEVSVSNNKLGIPYATFSEMSVIKKATDAFFKDVEAKEKRKKAMG